MIGLVYHLCLSTVRYVPSGLDDSYSHEGCTVQSKHIIECHNTSPDSQFVDTSDPHGISVNVSTIENAVKDPSNFSVELHAQYSFLSPSDSKTSFFFTESHSFPAGCTTKMVDFSNDPAYSNNVWLVCVDDSEASHSFAIYKGTATGTSISWTASINTTLETLASDCDPSYSFSKISIAKMDAYDGWMTTRIDFLFTIDDYSDMPVLGTFIFVDLFGPGNLLHWFLEDSVASFSVYPQYCVKFNDLWTDSTMPCFKEVCSVNDANLNFAGFEDWMFPSYDTYSAGTLGIAVLSCEYIAHNPIPPSFCLNSDDFVSTCRVRRFLASDFNSVLPAAASTTTINDISMFPSDKSSDKWKQVQPFQSIGIACVSPEESENGLCKKQIVIVPNNRDSSLYTSRYYVFQINVNFTETEDQSLSVSDDVNEYSLNSQTTTTGTMTDGTPVDLIFDDTKLVNGDGFDFMYSATVNDENDYKPSVGTISFLFARMFYSVGFGRKTAIFVLPLKQNYEFYDPPQFKLLDVYFLQVDEKFGHYYLNNAKIFGITTNKIIAEPLYSMEDVVNIENMGDEPTENIICNFQTSLNDYIQAIMFNIGADDDPDFQSTFSDPGFHNYPLIHPTTTQFSGCSSQLGSAGDARFYYHGNDIVVKASFGDAIPEDISPIQRVHTITMYSTLYSGGQAIGTTSTSVDLIVGETVSYLIVSNDVTSTNERIEVASNRICLGRMQDEYDRILIEHLFVYYITDDVDPLYYVFNSIDIYTDPEYHVYKNKTILKTEFPATFDLLCNQGEDATNWYVGVFTFDTEFELNTDNSIPVDFAEPILSNEGFEILNLNYYSNFDEIGAKIYVYKHELLAGYDLVDIEFRTKTTQYPNYKQMATTLFENSGNYQFCAFSVDLSTKIFVHHCFDFSPEYRNFTEFDCGHLSLTVTQKSNQDYHWDPQSEAVSFMCNGTNDDGDLTRSWFYSFESKTLHLVTDDGPFDTKATTGYDTVFVKTIPDTTGKLNNFDVVGVDHSDPDDIFFSTRYNIEKGIFSVCVTSNYDASEEWNQDALADAIQVTFPVAASLTVSLYSDESFYHSPSVSSETQENTLDDSDSPVSNFGPALQFDNLLQFSRLALEKKITFFQFVVQKNFDPFYSLIGYFYQFPILDDTDLGILIFLSPLESNFTLLLMKDDEYESNIFNVFDDRNVFWTNCPNSDFFVFAFFTTDATTGCNVNPSVLDSTDTNAVTRLLQLRLEQTIDDNVMLCFGASSVVYGNECGQHPLIHTSTEDCASEDDPFVCVDGDGEIFAFNTILKNVTTQCLSMSGTCASTAAFTSDTYSGEDYLSLEECKQLCIDTTDPTATCAFFKHANQDCTLYLRSDIDDEFLGEPCENGVLGFICRLKGSNEVLSTQVILDDSDPAFYTGIYQGETLLATIVHGELNASSMKMDRSGQETAFVLEFQSSFNVTGGQVIYVCGHDDDAYTEDSTDDRVLFTHPASEDDHFVNTTVQECFVSTHSLTFHEKQVSNSADPTMESCFDKQASGVFFAQGTNDDGSFKFYNIKPDASLSKSSPPSVSVLLGPAIVDEQWTKTSEHLVTFSVAPDKTLKSVVAYGPPSPYALNDRFSQTYWYNYLVSPTGTAPNEIRPVRLERVDRSKSSTEHGAGGSDPVDPKTAFTPFGIENSTTFDISDVLWGRFLNFKAYFFQESGSIEENEEVEFIHKYIFSMSEAFSRKMCPGFDFNNTNATETFPDGECVMTRLSHPVMRPLFSEQVTLGDRKFALGFTPYRVSPFMGVYLDDEGTDRIVMPDDAFIEEHGGIGFGAASSVDEFENQTVYSFGGFDYGPDPVFRPFEKLQFTTDDATMQWQPVWHRESQTFGCKDDNVQCTYSDDFYDNVVPQTNLGTVHHKLSTQMHVTGHAHSPNEFWHFVTQRNFQFPSVRDSAKCGPGDVTLNFNRLDDVNVGNTFEKISESTECNNELKIQVPLTPNKDVDFSTDDSIFKNSQETLFTFFISPNPDAYRQNVLSMLFQNTRKLPEFLKIWPALLNLDSFDPSIYQLLPKDTTQAWAKDCIGSRGVRMHEHEGSRGDGHYSDCYPQDTGTMLFLYKDRPENTVGPWVANDCNSDISSTTILDRFQYKKQSPPNQYSWEITFNDDTDIFNPKSATSSQTYWTIEGGSAQAFLYFLNNTNSDIAFLARECEVGNLALIKMIAFFDAPDTQFKKPDVMNKQYTSAGNTFDLSKAYTPAFFTDVFDCLHTTIYLGHNNDHLKQFCNERNYPSGTRHLSWYNVDGASTPTPENMNEIWPTTVSGHKFNFPTKVVDGFSSGDDTIPSGANGATCGKEMCLSPFPALLPPFQRNCDFYGIDDLPANNIEWRKCPMMPNHNFYSSDQTNGDSGDNRFFKRQIWRHPAFWSRDSGVWTSKAFRYDALPFHHYAIFNILIGTTLTSFRLRRSRLKRCSSLLLMVLQLILLFWENLDALEVGQ